MQTSTQQINNYSLQRHQKGPAQCPVCCLAYDHLYSVADCSHRFCKECSVAHIDAQAGNFAQAQCLQEGCKAPLGKNLPIYEFLSETTIYKLKQYEAYKFLQKHPDHISCKTRDCPGVFRIKEAKCGTCKAQHCKKCLELKHEGKCIVSDEDKQMKKLNFQKCPSCKIWVQRNKGCQYMQCKCGTDFCYRCGSQFSKDPCRKRYMWNQQVQIRQLLKNMPNIFTTQPLDMILLLPRLVVLILILTPLTLIMCIVPLVFIVSGFALVVMLCLPLSFCEPINQNPNPCSRLCLSIILLAFYPILSVFCLMVYMIGIILYPCYRNRDHHGAYDGLDKAVSGITSCYLQIVNCLMHCIYCG